MGIKIWNTPNKWSSFKKKYIEWWDNLSIDERVSAKKKFEKQSSYNRTLKNPYPDMPDIEHIRLSQLSDSHLYRIWCFKDKDEKINFKL